MYYGKSLPNGYSIEVETTGQPSTFVLNVTLLSYKEGIYTPSFWSIPCSASLGWASQVFLNVGELNIINLTATLTNIANEKEGVYVRLWLRNGLTAVSDRVALIAQGAVGYQVPLIFPPENGLNDISQHAYFYQRTIGNSTGSLGSYNNSNNFNLRVLRGGCKIVCDANVANRNFIFYCDRSDTYKVFYIGNPGNVTASQTANWTFGQGSGYTFYQNLHGHTECDPLYFPMNSTVYLGVDNIQAGDVLSNMWFDVQLMSK